MTKKLTNDSLRHIVIDLCLMTKGKIPRGCSIHEIVNVCSDGGLVFEQFCSYLLPFALKNHQEMIFDILEILCSSYAWPTGKGFAKVVLPMIYWASPDEALDFIYHLWDGNSEQCKAAAESLRAVLYRDFDAAKDLLYRCLKSDRETIRKEAPRALPCMSEIDYNEAHLFKSYILEYPDLLKEIEILDPCIPDKYIYSYREFIDVLRVFNITEYQPTRILYLRSLACGIPGLAIVNNDSALSRSSALSGFLHALIRVFGIIYLPIFAKKHHPRIESATANALHSDLEDDRLLGLIPAFLMASMNPERWCSEMQNLLINSSKDLQFLATILIESLDL